MIYLIGNYSNITIPKSLENDKYSRKTWSILTKAKLCQVQPKRASSDIGTNKKLHKGGGNKRTQKVSYTQPFTNILGLISIASST